MAVHHLQALAILGMTLVGVSLPAAEVDAPDVKGDVWLVRTQGTWTVGDRYGYYRVVVSRHGGEHSADTTAVQILEAKGDRLDSSLELLRTIVLPVPEYEGYVRDIAFSEVAADTMSIHFQIEAKHPAGDVFTRTFNVRIDGTFKERRRDRRKSD